VENVIPLDGIINVRGDDDTNDDTSNDDIRFV